MESAIAMEKEKRAVAGSRRKIRFFDYALLFIIIFLVAFGMVMLYSVSYYNAGITFDDPAYYVKKQLFAALLGLAALIVISRFDYHIFHTFAPMIYIVALGLNVLVQTSVGSSYSGSQRWISVGGISIQPSELAKVGVILFVAYIVSRSPKRMADIKGIITVFAINLPILAFVAMANLSTAIIIAGIEFVMIFVASPKYKYFMGIILALFGFMSVFLIIAPYRVRRIQIWLHPENFDEGYQTLQGLYAIGSGGIFGKGLGESLQKFGSVPEPENDMIFSIICEELGIVGAVAIILLFLLLLWRLMIIANNTYDLFGSMVVVGIMTHIALQVILNIAVVTNTIPNTGITLPFISYGGTSLSVLLAEMGIALSVSRGIRLENTEDLYLMREGE